jgi:NAD(P)-dependent dehydrogenase (short-subunit alcohol dehydrogenase family)
MLTEQMSLEWGREGIRVNAVSPGFIDSGMAAEHYADPVERQKRAEMVPIQKIGTARDIANVVMFLLSEESSYIHGENIVVDGGVMNSVLANIGRN